MCCNFKTLTMQKVIQSRHWQAKDSLETFPQIIAHSTVSLTTSSTRSHSHIPHCSSIQSNLFNTVSPPKIGLKITNMSVRMSILVFLCLNSYLHRSSSNWSPSDVSGLKNMLDPMQQVLINGLSMSTGTRC